jgi:hypothetical protein
MDYLGLLMDYLGLKAWAIPVADNEEDYLRQSLAVTCSKTVYFVP